MIKHKEQRVGILVDVSNMYHSAKNLYNRKANFKEILTQGVAGRKLIRATAYVVTTENKDEMNFFEALSQQGFEVKMKDLQIFAGGAKKGDWDVGITIDAMKLADKLDVIVLVSGDGDYLPAVSYLQNNKGCLVEIMAFRKTTSSKLIEEADDFIDLGSNKKFLI
ncbi:MAG: NYN domain-containing protein [Candidatus Falkowbacteria bacterium]